jgi:hypothetical protein
VAPQLAKAAPLLTRALDRLARDGVSRKIPWFITEFGYSPFGTRAEVDLPGAILNADIVGAFLAWGGAKTYLYGYEPGDLLHEASCTWGNNMLFLSGPPLQKLPSYYAATLLTQEWAQPSGGKHTMYAARTGDPRLAAYAVERPDGLLSILLLNKYPARQITVRVPFDGRADVYQYSPAQYEWRAAGANGHPIRNKPPVKSVSSAGEVSLPPYSITVVRGSQ